MSVRGAQSRNTNSERGPSFSPVKGTTAQQARLSPSQLNGNTSSSATAATTASSPTKAHAKDESGEFPAACRALSIPRCFAFYRTTIHLSFFSLRKTQELGITITSVVRCWQRILFTRDRSSGSSARVTFTKREETLSTQFHIQCINEAKGYRRSWWWMGLLRRHSRELSVS